MKIESNFWFLNIEKTVLWSDCDSTKVLSEETIYRWFQDYARVQFFMEYSLPEKYVLGKSGFTFYEFPKLNTKIMLKGRFQEVEDGYLLQEYQITNKDGEILVKGDGKIVPFDFKSQKKSQISQESKDKMKKIKKISKL
eukprot:gene9539-1744_t